MKNLRIVFIWMILSLLLTACTSVSTLPTETKEPEYLGNSPVPNIRTGIHSQGMSGYGNSMEITETGVYFMSYVGGGRSYLLYADHGSDTVVKLCARPDCTHSDRLCNAYFENGSSVYCDGSHLYVGEHAGTMIKVYRLDMDGGNRIQIMDNLAVLEGFNKGGGNVAISNGYCFFTLGKMVNGEIEETDFYFKLDGSMEQPAPLPQGYYHTYDDGSNILLLGPGKYDGRPESGRYLWDANTNTAQWIVDQPEYFYGYVGVNGIYYIDGGVIYRKNAGSETTDILFDTGLSGDHKLKGLPEYLVVMDTVYWWQDGRENDSLEGQTLCFYSWDFKLLGECEINYEANGSNVYENIIAGETAERIYLAAHNLGLPEYYIDKSDFGTGNIEIHPLELPEDIMALFSES